MAVVAIAAIDRTLFVRPGFAAPILGNRLAQFVVANELTIGRPLNRFEILRADFFSDFVVGWLELLTVADEIKYIEDMFLDIFIFNL